MEAENGNIRSKEEMFRTQTRPLCRNMSPLITAHAVIERDDNGLKGKEGVKPFRKSPLGGHPMSKKQKHSTGAPKGPSSQGPLLRGQAHNTQTHTCNLDSTPYSFATFACMQGYFTS